MDVFQNLFAIINDKNSAINRIPLTGALQSDIAHLFEEQKKEFIRDKQERAFSGSYSTGSDELFAINNYHITEQIFESIQNPISIPTLDLSNSISIKALFTGAWDDNKSVYFQSMDARKILKKGFTLINSQKTFSKLTDPGIILSNKLAAVYCNGKILFQSYHITNRFLDLSNYFREAADTELDDFISHDLFSCEDIEEFRKNADSIVRKKIALLLTNNILENITIAELETVAKEFNQLVHDENKINLKITGGRLIIPNDKKELKELIKFLDEDYFTTPFTKRKCLTNSKTYIS